MPMRGPGPIRIDADEVASQDSNRAHADAFQLVLFWKQRRLKYRTVVDCFLEASRNVPITLVHPMHW